MVRDGPLTPIIQLRAFRQVSMASLRTGRAARFPRIRLSDPRALEGPLGQAFDPDGGLPLYIFLTVRIVYRVIREVGACILSSILHRIGLRGGGAAQVYAGQHRRVRYSPVPQLLTPWGAPFPVHTPPQPVPSKVVMGLEVSHRETELVCSG